MIRLATYKLEEIFSCINNEKNAKSIFFVEDKEYKVRVSSIRLRCFKRSPICIVCGISGNIFALEKTVETDLSPHLNLYHVLENGKEILMTQDHIIPRSKGGFNSLDNVQTMCAECNVIKGNLIEDENLMCGLKKYIVHLISKEMSDKEIFNHITCGNMINKIGFQPDGGDFVTIIREILSTECAHV